MALEMFGCPAHVSLRSAWHGYFVAAVALDENRPMKRIRVAPGKFVTISDELAEKAARVFATGQLTRDQVRELVDVEPQLSSGAMAGSRRVLRSAKLRACARSYVRAAAPPRKVTLSSAIRRRTR